MRRDKMVIHFAPIRLLSPDEQSWEQQYRFARGSDDPQDIHSPNRLLTPLEFRFNLSSEPDTTYKNRFAAVWRSFYGDGERPFFGANSSITIKTHPSELPAKAQAVRLVLAEVNRAVGPAIQATQDRMAGERRARQAAEKLVSEYVPTQINVEGLNRPEYEIAKARVGAAEEQAYRSLVQSIVRRELDLALEKLNEDAIHEAMQYVAQNESEAA